MTIRKIHPYLNFDGTAEKAIRLYESALGAKTEGLSRYSEGPKEYFTPETKDRVMHALLRIGGGVVMVSDTQPSEPVGTVSNVQVTLDFDDATDMTKRFDALAKGGKVTMPLGDTFWGAKFGMLTDAYGIHWMFNCNKKPTPA